MIGTVVMDISDAEMRQAIEYYFNSHLFFHSQDKAKVTKVHRRSNGRFVVTFEGAQPERKPTSTGAAAAGSSGD